jgi:hypothetical protein
MSPESKPEWFQIADADSAASPRKISKGIPIVAILAFAAIIGVGTVVAQTQDEAPANAAEIVAPAINSNQNSASLETTTPRIANPLGKMPSGGEHEDGEDDNEGEDD